MVGWGGKVNLGLGVVNMEWESDGECGGLWDFRELGNEDRRW